VHEIDIGEFIYSRSQQLQLMLDRTLCLSYVKKSSDFQLPDVIVSCSRHHNQVLPVYYYSFGRRNSTRVDFQSSFSHLKILCK
jgi:hypothetical protein